MPYAHVAIPTVSSSHTNRERQRAAGPCLSRASTAVLTMDQCVIVCTICAQVVGA